jgi:hypothetical protein
MLKRIPLFGLALLLLASCRNGNERFEQNDTTTVTHTQTTEHSGTTTIEEPSNTTDTSSHVVTAPLTPVSPIEPDRLSAFLPEISGYTAEEIQKETRIRSNMKVSKAWRVYRNGDKKITVTVNDFAYVPSQYTPFEQYRGEYLQDDNIERTESTRISGYEAIQTWLKKENRAEITLFPGNRYVVQLTADGMNDISEARRVLDGMNLSALEGLK